MGTRDGVEFWGTCWQRGKTSATYPASTMPHNCLARHSDGAECRCAWCGTVNPGEEEG